MDWAAPLSLFHILSLKFLAGDRNAIKISVCGGAAGSLCVVCSNGWAERRLVLTDGGKTKNIAWRDLVPRFIGNYAPFLGLILLFC